MMVRPHSSRDRTPAGRAAGSRRRVHQVLANNLCVAASSGGHRRLVSASSSRAGRCCRRRLHEDRLIPCSRRVTATLRGIGHALVVRLLRLGAEVLADDVEDLAGTALFVHHLHELPELLLLRAGLRGSLAVLGSHACTEKT